MSKALCSYPKSERAKVALRRAKSSEKGLGYWGAMDFIESQKTKKKES